MTDNSEVSAASTSTSPAPEDEAGLLFVETPEGLPLPDEELSGGTFLHIVSGEGGVCLWHESAAGSGLVYVPGFEVTETGTPGEIETDLGHRIGDGDEVQQEGITMDEYLEELASLYPDRYDEKRAEDTAVFTAAQRRCAGVSGITADTLVIGYLYPIWFELD